CARLLETTASALAAQLAAIPYSSAILATLLFARADMPSSLDGFGFLVPRSERHTISAATFIGNKFPNRIPEHLFAIRGFIVDPEADSLLNASDDSILQLVREDFGRLLEVRSAPLFAAIHRLPISMPQYVVGHRERCSRVAELLASFPGLFLAGNAYDGVGIPDCVRLAKETANRVFASKAHL